MNERKWRQPRLQLHLVTKSCGRWELGLLTLSAAVLPLKMMPCTMFWFIQTFSVNGKFTERYHIFCAWIDLLFTIFVCSRYRLWATIRLLHHFGFVTCVNSRLYCTHFPAIDAKCVMFRVSWRKSLKGSATWFMPSQPVRLYQGELLSCTLIPKFRPGVTGVVCFDP